MTAEQKQMVHQHFEQVGMECIKTHEITAEDVTNLRTRKIPTGENASCFLSCIFKHVGIMDDNGLLQKESAIELAKKVFDDEEELKLIEDYLHSCSSVNTATVSDGEKGCERSLLAYKCMIENASQFGIDL
ncbi:odorant binding protein [Danaus plexippus plexippus]|uniref:Odorant binding protein n=1 Tax=Danaus plexippus plexippus TaxID=278856 RepID=A0A212ETE2_DANPL|nr:uncharacterized protein LOC116770688 isoform X2 [Danaus plexippus plexippus]XP_032518157.1 uncharacterized protein LOC116770688 isoform X2 [Danaus plexippus plexippus]OWR44714.1 odorant binding protein [Danaus plexippus plexippus]